jgi:hypothetical protein
MNKDRKTVAFGEIVFNIPVQSMNLVVYEDNYAVLGATCNAVCTHLGIGATGSTVSSACSNLKVALQRYIQDVVAHSASKDEAWTAINNDAFTRDEVKEEDFFAYQEAKHRYSIDMVTRGKSSIQERVVHLFYYFLQNLVSAKVLSRKARAFMSWEKLAA